MGKKAGTVWTHAVYLLLDPSADEKEATLLKIGDAHRIGGNFMIELTPGLSVSGRIVLKVREELPD